MPSPPPFKHPWIDESKAPIYVLTFPAQVSVEPLNQYYDAFEAWYKILAAPVAFVVNVDNIIETNAMMRKVLAERDARLAPYQAKYLRGTALLASTAFRRGLITAVYWLNKPVFPYKIFEKKEDAWAWARERLNSAK